MSEANRQPILLIEPNEQFREEVFNFLLTAGYEEIAAADSLAAAIDKIRQSTYGIAIVDAGKLLTSVMQFAEGLAGISPGARIIFMINAEDQETWDQIATPPGNIRFLIKTDFARNLLYLLEERAQS
jgi:DNA-binding NarL/FixJ family response regulator